MERTRLRIEYGNEELCRLATQADYRPKKWGPDVIRAYRKKIQVLDAATNQMDLARMRSLNLEKLRGDRADQWSIRLNDQFRLIITFRTEVDGQLVVVLELVDYH